MKKQILIGLWALIGLAASSWAGTRVVTPAVMRVVAFDSDTIMLKNEKKQITRVPRAHFAGVDIREGTLLKVEIPSK